MALSVRRLSAPFGAEVLGLRGSFKRRVSPELYDVSNLDEKGDFLRDEIRRSSTSAICAGCSATGVIGARPKSPPATRCARMVSCPTR